MALSGNRGEWSEPYVLLKLLADGKLYLGGENFTKIEELFYPIIKILRHEKERVVHFTRNDEMVVITESELLFRIPIIDFVNNAKFCFEQIRKPHEEGGSFRIPEIENFLSSFSITTLKAKSKLKNDITIQIKDTNTFNFASLGFSIKSQLGGSSTLVNASGATNFTYKLIGNPLDQEAIDEINNTREFSDKFKLLKEFGVSLEFEVIDNRIFRSNLQTIDYYFDKILSEILVHFYANDVPSENTIPKFIEKVTSVNTLGYDLSINSRMYELMIKKFLTDYALGMRAAEVWHRDYQATGGFLIVRDDGEIICYHFYYMKKFEDYLFTNTRLETGSPDKHKFGKIYIENGIQKIKLNLQVRFIK